MALIAIELQVNPGLASDFDLGTLHYGLLAHWRVAKSTGTREEVAFWPFRRVSGEIISLPGAHLDRDRMELERGHDSDLDRRLIRTSTFQIDVDDSHRLSMPTLQQLFVLVKAGGTAPISNTLGLRVLITGRDETTSGIYPSTNNRTIACRGSGPPPLLLWSSDEWRDDNSVTELKFEGNLPGYVSELIGLLNNASASRERREHEAAQTAPAHAPGATREEPPRPSGAVEDNLEWPGGPREAHAFAEGVVDASSLRREARRWVHADALRRGSWYLWSIPYAYLWILFFVIFAVTLFVLYVKCAHQPAHDFLWGRALGVTSLIALTTVIFLNILRSVARFELGLRLGTEFDFSGATARGLRATAANLANEAQPPEIAAYRLRLREVNTRIRQIPGLDHRAYIGRRVSFPLTDSLLITLFAAVVALAVGQPLYQDYFTAPTSVSDSSSEESEAAPPPHKEGHPKAKRAASHPEQAANCSNNPQNDYDAAMRRFNEKATAALFLQCVAASGDPMWAPKARRQLVCLQAPLDPSCR